MLGDSTTWGGGATPVGQPSGGSFSTQQLAMWGWERTSLPRKIQQLLNQTPNYGYIESNTTMGGGYSLRTARINETSVLRPFVLTGASPPALASPARGQGLNSVVIPSGATLAHTAKSATGFLWIYEDGASSGRAQFTITNASGSIVTQAWNGQNTGLPQYTRSIAGVGDLPRGQYTITFDSTPSANPVIDSLYVLDTDQQAGVRVHDWSWPGVGALEFGDGGGAGGTVLQASTSTQAIATVNPQLLIIMLGTNDYGGSPQYSAANFGTQLGKVIDNYRNTINVSAPWKTCVLVVAWAKRYDKTTGITDTWTTYVDQMRTVSAARTNVDFLDLSPWFPATQVADDADFDLIGADGVHGTNRGYDLAATMIAERLMAPFSAA